jgi:hypothetical protein
MHLLERAAVLAAAASLSASLIFAQDVLTVGSASIAAGGTANVPIYVRDAGGTPLGSDAGAGKRIQGIAFKITVTPASAVTSINFSRAGVIGSLTPLYERTIPSTAAIAYIGSFSETTNAIPFVLNGTGPGDVAGNLQIITSGIASGAVTLTIDPATAMLANQAGTTGETVANAGLSVTNGTLTVTVSPFGTPAHVLATAVTTSQVNVTWDGMSGVDHFEVYRTANINNAFTLVGSPASPAFNDTTVSAGLTYLYYVRAVSPSMTTSPFSAIDAATTILFTDDPLVAGTAIRAAHVNELRAAVNSFRVAANLAPFAFTDPSLTSATVRATHIQQLRDKLNEARAALSFATLTYTGTLTAGVTTIAAVHVQEIRNPVK